MGVPLISAYCASKWAVGGFSSDLRVELYGTGIGITTVYPAWVDTPMIHQEADVAQLMNIEVLLTPDQVAFEILQAVIEDRSDLTLAPNPEISFILQVYKDDPDKAETMAGKSYRERGNKFTQQQAAQKSQQRKHFDISIITATLALTQLLLKFPV